MIPVPNAVVERKARSPRKNLGPYRKMLVKNIYNRSSRELGGEAHGATQSDWILPFYP